MTTFIYNLQSAADNAASDQGLNCLLMFYQHLDKNENYHSITIQTETFYQHLNKNENYHSTNIQTEIDWEENAIRHK